MIIKAIWKQQYYFMEKQEILPRRKIIKHLKYGLILIWWFYGHAGRIQESYDSYLKNISNRSQLFLCFKRNCLDCIFSWKKYKKQKRIVEAIEITHNPWLLFIEISDCSIWREWCSSVKIGMLISLCLKRIIMDV
jgi:hypothetical protein